MKRGPSLTRVTLATLSLLTNCPAPVVNCVAPLGANTLPYVFDWLLAVIVSVRWLMCRLPST